MSARNAVSVALDLGATRIKAGVLGEDARFTKVISAPAPPLSGVDPVREGDAVAYLAQAESLLRELLADLPRGIPLGIAVQRSTFVLWDRETGRPATPLVSWLDRSAADWCARHENAARDLIPRTGLLLSPHYVGPKLAALQEKRSDLSPLLRDGRLLFGNLDAWVIRSWGDASPHETDLTVAARTLLVDPQRGDWDDEFLRFFGVPRACLPAIVSTSGRGIPLACGAVLTATVADQSSGAFALLGDETDVALVNLGTGGFVLRIAGAEEPAPSRYLRGCAVKTGSEPLYLLEGGINGLAATIDELGPGPTPLPERDDHPEAFCLPDGAGIGAPHWLPRVRRMFSAAARSLDQAGQRRIALEGVVFRVRDILEGLFANRPPRRILLAGGLAREPFVGAALAACLGRSVEPVHEAEATLLGAACLAVHLPRPNTTTVEVVEPQPGGEHLLVKFRRWRAWLDEVLDAPRNIH